MYYTLKLRLFYIQSCGYLIIVTGMCSVIAYIGLGKHVHLQEGAENICIVVQNFLLQLDSDLAALCRIKFVSLKRPFDFISATIPPSVSA